MSLDQNELYEFGDYRLNVGDHKIEALHGSANGVLREKPFQTLVYLLRNSGRLVTKQELISAVWPDAIVEEGNLGKAIYAIRTYLGEKTGERSYIETVPKHGYRFVADVKRVESLPQPDSVDVQFDPDATPRNAYQAYQLSRYHFNKVSFPDLLKSRFWLEEAIKFDPRFAPAHAALVEQLLMEVLTGRSSPDENFPKAKESLRKASDLDSSSVEFYVGAGFADFICDRNFTNAERNLRKALEINPHHVLAHKYLGELLMFLSRRDESEFHLRRAVEIDPLGLHSPIILMIALFLARKYQDLIAECDKYLAIYPEFPVAVAYRGLALEQVGRAAEAVVEYEKILREPGTEFVRWFCGSAYALTGDREKALRTVAMLDAESEEHFLSPTFQAVIYTALDEPEKAFEYLEKGLSERDPWMLWIAADPRYDKVRQHPTFNAFLRDLGFESGVESETSPNIPIASEPLVPKVLTVQADPMTPVRVTAQRAVRGYFPKPAGLAVISVCVVGIGFWSAGGGWIRRFGALSPAASEQTIKSGSAADSRRSPAYDHYVRGKVKVANENREDTEAAIKLLEQAVTIDPGFAQAHAQLARAYNTMAFKFSSDADRKRYHENADVAIEKALELNPDLAEGHFARGLILWSNTKGFPHEHAIRSYKRSLTLDPNSDETHHQLSLIYSHIGRMEEARESVGRALELNPNNTLARFRDGVYLQYQGKFDEALSVFKTIPREHTPLLMDRSLAETLIQTGRFAEAESIADDYLKRFPQDEGGSFSSVKALLRAKTGDVRGAEEMIASAITIGKGYGHFHHSAYNISCAYAAMGRTQEAVRWLEFTADNGFPNYPYFAIDPNLNSIRDRSEFVQFMTKLRSRWEGREAAIR